MANLWQPSLQRITDANGDPVSTAQFEIYREGSLSIFEEYFLDPEGLTPGPNPLPSKGFGLFPAIYLDGSKTYRIRCVNTANGDIIIDVDNQSGLATETAIATDAANRASASAEIASAASQVTQDLSTAELYSSVDSFPVADGTNGFALILFGDEEGVYEDVQGDPDASWVRQGDTQALRSGAFSDLSQAWAEGTEPGGVGTKSSREHSIDASAEASRARLAANQAETARQATFDIIAASGTTAAISGVLETGWEAMQVNPQDLSLEPVMVIQQGFDRVGEVTQYLETPLLTKRVRQKYPNETNFTTDRVAVSRSIYRNTRIIGAENYSTITSPKPNMRWLMPRNPLVGNLIRPSVEAHHKDAREGQQIASVRWRAVPVAGGSPSEWFVVGQTRVSTIANDPVDIEAFEEDFDISAMPDGVYYLECEGRPWLGDSTSIRSSEDADVKRDFGRFYFTKDVARFAARPVAYVDLAGDDATGVWSTNGATAAASPYSTHKAAIEAIPDTSVTGGIADGCIIYFGDGTHTVLGPASTQAIPMNSASLTLEGSPNRTSDENVILEFNAIDFQVGINEARNGTTLNPALPYAVVTFKNLLLRRTGNSNLSQPATGTASLNVLYQFHDVVLDNDNRNTRFLNPNGVSGAIYGMRVDNMGTSSSIFGGLGNDFILLRSILCDDFMNADFDGFSAIGCVISNIGTASLQDPINGFMVSWCVFTKMTKTLIATGWDSSIIVERLHMLNVLIEHIGTATTNPSLTIASNSGSSRGMTIHHVTITGAQNVARVNIGYDNQNNAADNEQTHGQMSIIGLSSPTINIKTGPFRNSAEGDTDLSNAHGVDWEGIYTLYSANSPRTEHPDYPGINSSLGESSELVRVPENTVYTDYQGTTAPNEVLTAGTGGGVYTPVDGSPLLNLVTRSPVIGRDLAGVVRTGPQASGAFAPA